MWYVSSSKLSSKFRTPCTCSPVAAPRPWTAVSSARKSSVQRGYDMSMSLNRCLLDIKQLNARPAKETGDLPRWSCHTSSNKKFNWNIQPSTGPSQTSLWFQPIWKILYSQVGSFPQVGVKIKNIWNHHRAFVLPQGFNLCRLQPSIGPGIDIQVEIFSSSPAYIMSSGTIDTPPGWFWQTKVSIIQCSFLRSKRRCSMRRQCQSISACFMSLLSYGFLDQSICVLKQRATVPHLSCVTTTLFGPGWGLSKSYHSSPWHRVVSIISRIPVVCPRWDPSVEGQRPGLHRHADSDGWQPSVE